MLIKGAISKILLSTVTFFSCFSLQCMEMMKMMMKMMIIMMMMSMICQRQDESESI